MAEKTSRKDVAKKPEKSLKEKRAAKKIKKSDKATTLLASDK